MTSKGGVVAHKSNKIFRQNDDSENKTVRYFTFALVSTSIKPLVSDRIFRVSVLEENAGGLLLNSTVLDVVRITTNGRLVQQWYLVQ